jgi:glyoxylase-like metal-dependent hydrolase (beta-lactamase superfamily II)
MTSVPFVTESEVRYGEVETLSPSIRRIVANNPGPYTFHGTDTFIVGRGEVAVIDPGPDDQNHVDAILKALEPGERVSHLVVTHTHSDHSPAARELQDRTAATSYGFGPQLRVDDPDPTTVVFNDPEADPEPSKPTPRGRDVDFKPDEILRDGDVVEGAHWRLEAVHTPGHASNHLCYSLHEEQVLITGDHVMGWSTSVISPPDGNLGEYLASLEKLLARPQESRYLPAHGPEIRDPHVYVRALLAHRRERSEQILAVLESGPSTIAEMVPRIYATTRKVLWPAAASSVYAHLLHLYQIGLVVPDAGPPLRRASRIRKVKPGGG